ncbi:MAG: HEAT repeat domain-containing protein [Terriglobia bacterium]
MRSPGNHIQTVWNIVCLSLVCVAVAFLFRAARAGGSPPSPASHPPERRVDLGVLRPDSLYGVTVSVKSPVAVQGKDSIHVTIADAAGPMAEKWLHSGDLDFYLTLAPRAAGHGSVLLAAGPGTAIPQIAVSARRMPVSSRTEPAVIAAYPNGDWRHAQPFEFGQAIYGSADERPYAPAPGHDVYAAMIKGFQWFRFTFHGQEPRLAYFVLDVTDRDVPFDVYLYQAQKDKSGQSELVPYKKGEFVYQIESTQNYPGLYKFRTRILEPGQTYYVRVDANHPAYQLRTYSYPVPPYTDPHQAVRTGMDFLIDMGDTWLSNTPRRGSVALRNTMTHSETELCIACHPSQFTTRGEFTAIRNGYAPTQRTAIEFITDRLYNNARPLYGEPGTNWVRVIYSARAVSSRLPLLTHWFETEVTHDGPRASFAVPYANYLKIHYKDRTTMPGNEVDGCEPDISPFEIADQSWQTFSFLYQHTHDPQWLTERDRVVRLAVPYVPKNMIDLNWKIQFLATIGREKYSQQLDALIKQLYSYQEADGMWPYPFDKTRKTADFISYHAIYALALAGRRPETDPNMARAVTACMRAQRTEGDWEGDPVYQGFNTPFRATEFAVMALSQLYPGPDKRPLSAKGWDDAFPAPPTRLVTGDLPRLLSQLDQFWDLAPEPTLKQIRQVLATNPQPLAREAAARALGHMADPGAIPVLVHALGDQSKVVQCTAAWALRKVLTRRPDVAEQGSVLLTAALRSPDARVRWGATRLFNQHFSYLTDHPALLAGLIKDVNDPAPFVRFQAAAGLWRWYYWKVDHPAERNAVLEALATRLGIEQDPMVRRGLMESVYDVLDENTGYMAAWVRTAATKEDQERIENGYEAVVRDQAGVLARVLRAAPPQGRVSILNAMWDFHIRHYALPALKPGQVAIGLPKVLTQYVEGVPNLDQPDYVYPPYQGTANFRYDPNNSFYQTRVGNDSDLIHFFNSSGPQLEEALIDCLRGADSNTKIEVLKAGSTLEGAGDQRFALAALNLAMDPDARVRQTVNYVYENGQRGVLNINTPDVPNPELVKAVVEILQRSNVNARAVVLPLLASLPDNSPWTRENEVAQAVDALLRQEPRPKDYALALTAASSFGTITRNPQFQDRVFQGLHDPDSAVEKAAVDTILERFLNSPAYGQRIENAFAQLGSPQRTILITEVTDPQFMRLRVGTAGLGVSQDAAGLLANKYAYVKYKTPDFLQQPVVLKAVIASLYDKDANVRALALDALRRADGIEKQPDFQAALRRLQNDPNPRLQLIAANVLGGKTLADALADVKPNSVLNYDYFVKRVEPILAQVGPDGKACVICHASHAIFKLTGPDEQGKFLPSMSEQNYKYAMRVVDISDPRHSLILVKPTHKPETGGNVTDYYASHNGGQRWKSNEDSWQYKTILEWIEGARLQTAENNAPGRQ